MKKMQMSLAGVGLILMGFGYGAPAWALDEEIIQVAASFEVELCQGQGDTMLCALPGLIVGNIEKDGSYGWGRCCDYWDVATNTNYWWN